MNKQECIKQLEDLKQHCQYQSIDNDPIWNDDVQALDMAIEELKRTAPEVPVQEQLSGNFNPNTGEKLSNTCSQCWVMNKAYNCGYAKCPGIKLLVNEVKKLLT